jgi:hypothetical protein
MGYPVNNKLFKRYYEKDKIFRAAFSYRSYSQPRLMCSKASRMGSRALCLRTLRASLGARALQLILLFLPQYILERRNAPLPLFTPDLFFRRSCFYRDIALTVSQVIQNVPLLN